MRAVHLHGAGLAGGEEEPAQPGDRRGRGEQDGDVRGAHGVLPPRGPGARGGGPAATEEITMMYWGNGMGGWGMVLMTISSLLFWGLVIAGIVALVRYAGRSSHVGAPPGDRPTPQQVLAERFA